MLFKDRTAAGQFLAGQLASYANRPEVIVLGLPRGGVPVAFEVAKALNANFDVFLVRKLGVPGQEELAMGAIASGGVRVLNQAVVRSLRISTQTIDKVTHKEQQELARREQLYRDGQPEPTLENRTVILVDDGLATGATMRAAVMALREQHPAQIVVAVPISAPETCDQLKETVDDILCAMTPQPFQSVGVWYENFSQTTDQEVRRLLNQAALREPSPSCCQ